MPRATVPMNPVERNAVFADTIKRETDEIINRGGLVPYKSRKNTEFWNNTQTSIIFSGHGYKLDYTTTLEKEIGPRPGLPKEEVKAELPPDAFVPELGYATTNGDYFGYGDKMVNESKVNLNQLKQSGKL